MKTVDLDGKESYWNLAKGKRKANASSYHREAIKIIKSNWPSINFVEEIPIKIQQGLTLYIDIYIPLWKKAIEIHGSQHYKFNKFFHLDRFALIKQQNNDKLKAEWCELNEIELIELAYNRIDEWRNLIRS